MIPAYRQQMEVKAIPVYRGADLNADIDAVWEAAARHFPAMAAAYHSANSAVYRTHEVIFSDGQSQFMTPWRGVCDELIAILGTSSRNVEDTGTALREAMTAYARQDAAIAEALNRAMVDLPDFVPELPPTRVPLGSVPHNPYSQSWNPVSSDQLEGLYTGNAPTVEELLAMAQQVDDNLYEASLASEGLYGDVLGLLRRSWIEGEARRLGGYASTMDLVGESVRGNPAWYEQGIVTLQDIADLDADSKPFGMFRTEVDNAKDALDPEIWDGDAAREFRSSFLNAYEDIAATQALVVSLLQSALVGYKQALEDTYRSYLTAMDATINACQSIIDDAAAEEHDFATAVLQAVLIGGGILATGGTAALFQTAALFSLAEPGISIASSPYIAGGGEVEKVYVNLVQSVNTIKAQLDDFDRQLADGLSRDRAVLLELRSRDRMIELPRPDFADDPSLF